MNQAYKTIKGLGYKDAIEAIKQAKRDGLCTTSGRVATFKDGSRCFVQLGQVFID